MDRAKLIQEAIAKAYEEQEKATIRTTENGFETIRRFYKKGKAIWMYSKTGCIESNNRVYKVDSDKPYIRECGYYFYLDEQDKAIIAAL